MKTFFDIIPVLPPKFIQKINNWEYLRGVLEAGYNEPWRQYHTLEHVYDMLVKAQNPDYVITSPVEFAIAILFHDVVYGFRANPCENEKQSAQVALHFGSQYFDNFGVNWELVEALIMATTHIDSLHDSTYLQKLIADLDMSTFGTLAKDESLNISNKVIGEYSYFYPYPTVLEGHIKFLESLIARGFIFYTSHFLNESAMKDIQMKIDYFKENYEHFRNKNTQIGCG